MNKKNIYLDYASTTPTDPEVMDAMEPYYFKYFGNPSSPHSNGRESQKALEDARQKVAEFIGATPEEIIFTSGATESNNHAVMGSAGNKNEKGGHIITSRIEHHSVLEPAEHLEKQGFNVTYLGINSDGMVDPEDVEKAINDRTFLISIIHANNEIGAIQPVSEIGKIAKEHHIPFHIDSVQAVGHIPVNVNDLGVDMLSLTAHKFYGPKGIGAFYIRKGTQIRPFLLGGSQEKGQRASTQNVPGAVGLAKAAGLCKNKLDSEMETQTRLRNRLLDQIPKLIDGVKINGGQTSRLPNNANFSFEKVQGEALIMSLDMAGIAVSMGSACTSGAMEPSHVLRAIGLTDEEAFGSLRITVGRWTTDEDIDYLLEQLPKSVKSLRI